MGICSGIRIIIYRRPGIKEVRRALVFRKFWWLSLVQLVSLMFCLLAFNALRKLVARRQSLCYLSAVYYHSDTTHLGRSLFTNFHFIFTHMDLISQFVSAILEPTLVSCLEMMPEMIILGASVLHALNRFLPLQLIYFQWSLASRRSLCYSYQGE